MSSAGPPPSAAVVYSAPRKSASLMTMAPKLVMTASAAPTGPYSRWHRSAPSGASAVACVGFALPVPLVFAYPYVLGTARLGAINAALHLWLLAAWTCQGLGIAALCDALDSDAPAGKRDS